MSLELEGEKDDSPDKKALESEWIAEVCISKEEEELLDASSTTMTTTGGHDITTCVGGEQRVYVRWRHLAEWEARYEDIPTDKAGKDDGATPTDSPESIPSKGGGESVPSTDLPKEEAAVSPSPSRDKQLDKLREDMQVKMMDILLEVLSRVLDLFEAAGRASASTATMIPRIFNSLDAVTLTYRFDRCDPPKFAYLRQLASDQTADVVRIYLAAFDDNQTATSSAEQVFALQRHVQEFVTAHSSRAKDIVVGLLDERVTQKADEALDGALAVTQQKLDEAGARLDEASVGMPSKADASSKVSDDNDDGAEEAPETKMEKMRHAMAGGTQKLEHVLAQEGAKAKEVLSSQEEMGEEVVKTLGKLIEKIMTRGVSGLLKHALGGLDNLIQSLADAHEQRMARIASGEVIDEKREMREETFRFVESVHNDLQKKVLADTDIAVKVIGHTMSDKQLTALVNRFT